MSSSRSDTEAPTTLRIAVCADCGLLDGELAANENPICRDLEHMQGTMREYVPTSDLARVEAERDDLRGELGQLECTLAWLADPRGESPVQGLPESLRTVAETLERVSSERDRLADALRPFLAAADEWEAKNNATFSEPADPRYDSDEWYAEIEVCNNDVRDAREALNGTTPQPSQTPERRTVETPGEQGGPAVESSHETEA